MQEITSINNDLVKQTVKLQQKKFRDRENKFLLEGFKCIEEAFNAGIEIEYAFVSDDKKYAFLAVAVKKNYTLSDLKDAKKVVLLENIKDLGNLGTILRTSTAFCADAVVLYGKECADIYNPKCVRASVGNLWKIPVVYIDKFEELKKIFDKFERVATLPRAKDYLKTFSVKAPVLVMFGSEADGLSNELINFSTKEVKIEMASSVESLNLSVSCAVVLYKLFL